PGPNHAQGGSRRKVREQVGAPPQVLGAPGLSDEALNGADRNAQEHRTAHTHLTSVAVPKPVLGVLSCSCERLRSRLRNYSTGSYRFARSFSSSMRMCSIATFDPAGRNRAGKDVSTASCVGPQ